MITQEEVRRLFHYDPISGVFTRKVVNTNRVKVGSVAGTKRPDGYLKITIYGKHYLAHRLAWFYVHGEWPSEMTDHKNLDRGDTRLANLRDSTRSDNYANTRVRSHSKIGIKGVRKNGKRWMASISLNSQSIYLGTFDTPEEAGEAYAKAAREIRGEFARVQ